jgi:RNA polymerase sigma-70 factor (ECF subfamily)
VNQPIAANRTSNPSSQRTSRRAKASAGAASKSRDAASREDEAVFTQMVKGCQERIFRLALRITRNHADAEDAQQETLLKAHRKLRQFEGRARFTTWISRIAINESLMSLRKRRDAFRVPLDDAAQPSDTQVVSDHWQSAIEDPETAYSRRELQDILSMAIGNLPPRVRIVFLLRAVEDLSVIETAKILNTSTSAVKARLRRARLILQQDLRRAMKIRNPDASDESFPAARSSGESAISQWAV